MRCSSSSLDPDPEDTRDLGEVVEEEVVVVKKLLVVVITWSLTEGP